MFDTSANGSFSEVRGRPRAVLELLLINTNNPVSASRLISELWPKGAPDGARNSLHRFISDLRRALGEDRAVLETTPDGYRLAIDLETTDLGDVRCRRERSRAVLGADPREAAELLRGALEHFRLPAPGWQPLTACAEQTAAEFAELRLDVIEERIEAELRSGLVAGHVAELRDLVAEAPYREHLWSQLMRALAMEGRRVEALRAYRSLGRILADDIGISPSAELAELEASILDGSWRTPSTVSPPSLDGTDAAFPAGPRPGPRRRHLVGRQTDVDALLTHLMSDRLVSITGPGGAGKTQLALEVFRRWTGAPGAIVRLEEIDREDRVIEAIAAALRIRTEATETREVEQVVFDHLASRPALLVLDNAEHLVAGVNDVVKRISDRSADTQFLVTTRHRLGLSGEVIHDLAPLSREESVELFRRRSAEVGVMLAPSDEAHVRSICERLDGLPLAIELSAAQLGFLGLVDVAERLDDRLEAFRRQGRGSDRQRTLEATMSWSWSLLDEAEQATLCALAEFRGPVPATSIDSLSTHLGVDAFAAVSSLVAKSLVVSAVGDGRANYALLETVRIFARSRAEAAGTREDFQRAQVEYLFAFLRRWTYPELNSWADTLATVSAHQLEYEPAMERLLASGRHAELIELVVRTAALWARTGSSASLAHWAECIADLAPTVELSADLRAGVCVVSAEAAHRIGDFGALIQRGLELVEYERVCPTDLGGSFLGFLGTAGYLTNVDLGSRSLVESGLERAEANGDPLNTATHRMWLGCCALVDRRFDQAVELFASARRDIDRPGGVRLWSELGTVGAHLMNGDAAAALSAMNAVRSLPDEDLWHYALDIVRATTLAGVGSVSEAREHLADSARRFLVDGLDGGRSDYQIGFGIIALIDGDRDHASSLLQRPIGRSPVTNALLMHYVLPGHLDAAAWRKAWRAEMAARHEQLSSAVRSPLPVDAELARWWPDGA